jgi:hypothetical protein
LNKITIKNPDTGKVQTISQTEFNQFMSMTNGQVLQWVVSDKQLSQKSKPAKVTKSLEEALADVKLEWIEE